MSDNLQRCKDIEDARRSRFLALLGEFTLNWNFAEIWLRQLVQLLSAPSVAGQVLIADMSTSQLLNALNALAKDFSDEPARTHLLAVEKGIEALRPTRNLYLHGIFQVSVSENWTSSMIQSFSARGGRLKVLDMQVRPEHLEEAVSQSGAWAEYARQVFVCQAGINPDGWSDLRVPKLHVLSQNKRPLFREQDA